MPNRLLMPGGAGGMRRRVWALVLIAILVGAAVGGAVAIAMNDGKDVFQGAPTGPTPSDHAAAEVEAFTDDAQGLYSLVSLIAATGTPDCGPTTVCGNGSNAERLETLNSRCLRSGYPDDTTKPKSDKAQALLDALNSACGRAAAAKNKPPTTDAEWVAFARVSIPQFEDAYKAATGHPINDQEQTK